MRELTRPINAAMTWVARSQLRIPSVGVARLRRDGAPDVRIRLGNISRSGFMGEGAPAEVHAGMTIQLVLPFGRVVGGTVRSGRDASGAWVVDAHLPLRVRR